MDRRRFRCGEGRDRIDLLQVAMRFVCFPHSCVCPEAGRKDRAGGWRVLFAKVVRDLFPGGTCL